MASIPNAAQFPGLATPAAGFDQPFDMLAACHERVRRSLALLERLVPHVERHGADREARDAALDVLRYFTIAAPAHHEDEERHVVPALLESDDAQAQAAARRILADHAEIRAAWAVLEPILAAIADGSPPLTTALQRGAQRFIDLHADHLQLEDALAFPTAAQRIDSTEARRAMGQEMAQRRGVSAG
jgi:hemerythrin-like domain-containing protein